VIDSGSGVVLPDWDATKAPEQHWLKHVTERPPERPTLLVLEGCIGSRGRVTTEERRERKDRRDYARPETGGVDSGVTPFANLGINVGAKIARDSGAR
jgi:hypothetical protein